MEREQGGQRHCPVWRESKEVNGAVSCEGESEEVSGTVPCGEGARRSAALERERERERARRSMALSKIRTHHIYIEL